VGSKVGKSGLVAALLLAVAITGLGIGGARAETIDTRLYAVIGTVTDATGAPIEGAAVSDGTRSTLTDELGGYRLGYALPGTHVIRVSKAPYAASEKQMTLIVPGEYRFDFELQE
jgi:hypothetical protein